MINCIIKNNIDSDKSNVKLCFSFIFKKCQSNYFLYFMKFQAVIIAMFFMCFDIL